MDLYTAVSREINQLLTTRYSTSFGMSSKLFAKEIRADIYAIYGLVRVADEVVDTYRGADGRQLLDELEQDTYAAIDSQYSTNPIIHAFAITARKFGIGRDLIEPFFASMRMDLDPQSYTADKYQQYIHGSAEVVGLMCLRVFCEGSDERYAALAAGAAALGSAYQKVNFLRDIASDYNDLQRLYFPGITFASFDEQQKQAIIRDIKKDFQQAKTALDMLPRNSRAAVATSYTYYRALLKKLEATPVATLKERRVRISNSRKLWLLGITALRYKVFA